MKENYDKKICQSMTFDPRQIVVVRCPPKLTGERTKTQAKYGGPLIIVEALSNDTYKEETRKKIERQQQKMKEDYVKKICRSMTFDTG